MSNLKTIDCDQMALIGDALDRYAMIIRLTAGYPRCSYMADFAKTATLMEIIDHLHLYLLDEGARNNLAPSLFRKPLAPDLDIACDTPKEQPHE